MNDSVIAIIVFVLLIVIIAAFFILNNYGYNVSLMELIILFIIFLAIIVAYFDADTKNNKHHYTPKPTPRNPGLNDDNDDPIINFDMADGKMPDLRNIDFSKYGIGGLDEELRKIIRSGLYTRFLPKDKIKAASIKHDKGIILHGPPGTGKTTIARFMARALQAKSVQIINGPEIFNKYVGQSEENLRDIFKPAKNDYNKLGDKAPLHVVIFDEIDAIAPARGRSLSGVNDTVVNQFLTEMDGVEEYDNILVFGTTNRLDMMDQGLLRSGRFDLKIKIGLPDQKARWDILKVHTKGYKEADMFSKDIDLQQISNVTEGYTGADLECLLKKAFNYASERYMDNTNNELIIAVEDINKALQEVEPQDYSKY